MAQIGEQAKKISSTLTDKYPKIPWAKIKGFRNRIIHDYVGIDIENVFQVIQTEVPDLHNEVVSIVSTELLIGTFDREEFEIAKTSPYLKHIDFSLFWIDSMYSLVYLIIWCKKMQSRTKPQKAQRLTKKCLPLRAPWCTLWVGAKKNWYVSEGHKELRFQLGWLANVPMC